MEKPTDLLVEGDSCDSCSEQWSKQGQPPRKLVALNRRTGNKSYPVVICPYCDGQPILDLQPQADDGATAEEV